MKKTITVNLFGTLYPIDEDAYALLKQYQDSLRACFSSRNESPEIAEDIEYRIAELLSESLTAGAQSITIADIQSIIERIGKPEELGGETSDTPHAGPAEKKLFRDTDHQILGGVFAGLGKYFGINPAWLRLAAILLFPASYGVIFVAYLVAWAAIPAATTPLDRLQMSGSRIDLGNLSRQILESVNADHSRNAITRGINAILQLAGSVVKAVLFATAAIIVLVCVALIVAILIFLMLTAYNPSGMENPDIVDAMHACPAFLLCATVISALLTLSLIIYFGVNALMRFTGRAKPIGKTPAIVCGMLWVASLSVFIASMTRFVQVFDETSAQSREEHANHWTSKERKILEAQGWQIAVDVNTGGHYVKNDQHYSGSIGKYYIDTWSNVPSQYEVLRTVKVAPGTYTLQAAARADGDGCEIFARTSSGSYATAVPAYANEGGLIWEEAMKEYFDTSATTQSAVVRRRAEANRGKGYGWSRVTVPAIKVGSDSTVTYGVTNVATSSAWNGTWFSACDFELKRAGK